VFAKRCIDLSSFDGDPAIKWPGADGGDLVKNNGDYDRDSGIRNIIIILLGTKKNLWSNVFKTKNKIPGFEITPGAIITLGDLRNYERDAANALEPMKRLNLADSIIVTASNPEADIIIFVILIVAKSGKESEHVINWNRELKT
jgi:phage gp46-like protein